MGCGVAAGLDGQFFPAVRDPIAGVLDDDGDELAGVPGAELDRLLVDHDPAAGVDLAPGGDRPGRQGRRGHGGGCAEPGGAFGGDRAGPGASQGAVGDGVHQVRVQPHGDCRPGQPGADLVFAPKHVMSWDA